MWSSSGLLSFAVLSCVLLSMRVMRPLDDAGETTGCTSREHVRVPTNRAGSAGMRSGAGASRRRRGRQPLRGRHRPGSRRRRRRARCVRSGIGARSRVAMLAAVLPAAPLSMLQPGISTAASRDRQTASSGTRRSTTRARSSLSTMATSARSRSRVSRSITACSRPEGDALGARSCRARRFVSPLPVRAERA